MIQRKYQPPKIGAGDLITEITFYTLVKDEEGAPSKERKKTKLYNCLSKVDNVWSKDIEIAKANGTLSDITILIRNPYGEYIPKTDHFLEVHADEYKTNYFDIKEAFPDLQHTGFVKIIAELRK